MARSYWSKYRLLFSVLFLLVTLEDSCLGEAKRSDPKQKKEKDKKIGKDVLDYTEADLFKLLDQWEVSTSCRLMCICFAVLRNEIRKRSDVIQRFEFLQCMVEVRSNEGEMDA